MKRICGEGCLTIRYECGDIVPIGAFSNNAEEDLNNKYSIIDGHIIEFYRIATITENSEDEHVHITRIEKLKNLDSATACWRGGHTFVTRPYIKGE